MKKFLALVLAMLMVFSLCACGDGGDSSGYSQSFGNAPAPAANSYAAPASAPTSDFSMIEDDDSQLPV